MANIEFVRTIDRVHVSRRFRLLKVNLFKKGKTVHLLARLSVKYIQYGTVKDNPANRQDGNDRRHLNLLFLKSADNSDKDRYLSLIFTRPNNLQQIKLKN